jgi:twinkle protein
MGEKEMVEGTFLGHTECPHCSSSDAHGIYQHFTDSGEEYFTGFCFSCQQWSSHQRLLANNLVDETGYVHVIEQEDEGSMSDVELVKEITTTYDTRGVRERKLPLAMAEMYGMKVSYDQSTGEIDAHYYPVTKEGQIVGYFKRTLPKQFSAIGDVKNCELQGQHLFDKGGEYENKAGKKFLILTEGYLDMLAAQKMMQDNANREGYVTAVVSLPNGINTKSVKTNYNFLNSFEKVLVCVDQDDVGKKGAREICKCLPLGKTKIMSFSEKDPCDMLKKGKGKEFYSAFWNAEDYSPAGILDGRGLWEAVSSTDGVESIPYPWDGLTKVTHGIRTGEMVTLTAGSGVAKSTFARKILHHILKTTDANVGGMFLEESVKRTALSIMSMEANKLLHLPDVERTTEEMKAAFDATLGTGRVFLYDHFGSADIDTICENITYFVRAADCKYIFLDHISIMVSAGGHGDERKALDEICTKLRTLVQELDICLFIISHLKRPSDGKGHEEGCATSLSQLRGSAGIAQLSDMVIGFERNGQAEDPVERNTTTIRVLKNRYSGNTSVAARVLYNNVTGELVEVKDLEEDADMSVFENKVSSDEFSDPILDEMY